jgi:hypothetical protein
MKPSALFIAAFFLGALADSARAQGMIEWAKKYPKTERVNKQILVKGKVALDKGWKIVGNSVLVKAWEDGSFVKEFKVEINKDGKTWGEAKLALAPGVEYNVTVEVRVTDGKSWEILCTEFKRAQTK